MTPSFVIDVQNIYKPLGAQSEVTRSVWKDSVGKRFYEQYVKRYKEDTDLYIYGGQGMKGRGLNDLLMLFDKSQKEMAQLGAGINDSNSENKIHNDRRERLGYSSNELNPSELNAPDIKGIMNRRW